MHEPAAIAVTDSTWGIGWYPTASGAAPYAPTHSEIARATDVAAERLAALGIGPDEMIVFASKTSEALQFAPYEAAANRLGAAYSCLDGNRADGQRLRSLIQLLAPRAVLGIGEDLVLGVRDLGLDVAELLADVPVLAARPKARDLLAAAGVPAVLWLHAGPAVAVGCRAADGAHLDEVWSPAEIAGELQIAATGEGATSRLDTGIRGTPLAGPCQCGSTSPRVVLAETPDFTG